MEDIPDEGSVARPATVINDTSDDMSGDIDDNSDDVSGDISNTSGADVNQANSGDTDHNMTPMTSWTKTFIWQECLI